MQKEYKEIQFENALIMRICHDLITPFNAISLGMEAFDMSGDKSLLNDVKESITKANIILKFIRELYSTKSNTFCYSLLALRQFVASFLEKYSIKFELRADSENIPNIAGKIIMYNAIMTKEIMPLGGTVNIKINDNFCEIITVCSGNSIADPAFDINDKPNYKNVMRFCLLKLLKESNFKITAYQEESKTIIKERIN